MSRTAHPRPRRVRLRSPVSANEMLARLTDRDLAIMAQFGPGAIDCTCETPAPQEGMGRCSKCSGLVSERHDEEQS